MSKNIFYDYKYIWITLGLAVFLLGPFILKLKDPRLEIYPAVIMPSGARTISLKDSIKFFSLELYGIKNKQWERIPIKPFFKPIPDQYFYAVSKSNFGFQPQSDVFKLYKPPIKFNKHNRYSKKELEKTKKYFEKKLLKLGFSGKVFKCKTYINVKYKNQIDKNLLNEYTYQIK